MPGRTVPAAAAPIATEVATAIATPARSVAPKPIATARRAGRVETGRMRRRGMVIVVMTTWQETRTRVPSLHDGRRGPGNGPDECLRFPPRIQPLGSGQAPRRWSLRFSPVGARLSSGTLGRFSGPLVY